MMAAAFIQIAFNFGNAVGAYAGGLPIDACGNSAEGYRYPALVGVATVTMGIISLVALSRKLKTKEE